MKDLIIVAAGSQAREFLQYAKDINAIKPTWNIKGFIADGGDDIYELTNHEYRIISSIEDWTPSENEEFVVAISAPDRKKKVVQELMDKGAHFATLIHPTAHIDDYSVYGRGLVMYPHATIGMNTKVGDFVTICGCVAHDNSIADYVTLSGDATVSGHVTVGECAFLGAKSIIAPGLSIGKNAFVCIGSVVIRSVRDNTKVIGNPAKRIDF